jgi:hypothetical protein
VTVALDQPAGAAREQTLRQAADAYWKAARIGAAAEPSMAAGAVLTATARYDHVNDPSAGDAVLRWAVEGLPRSPEILFAAALRFADGDFIAAAVDLDPTLARDGSWPELAFAGSASAGLLERQNAALAAVGQWESEVATAATVDTLPAEPPAGSCAAGFHALERVAGRLAAVKAELGRPGGAELGHLERARAIEERAGRVRAGEGLRPPAPVHAAPFVAAAVLLVVVGIYIGLTRFRDTNPSVPAGEAMMFVLLFGGPLVLLTIAARRSQRRTRELVQLWWQAEQLGAGILRDAAVPIQQARAVGDLRQALLAKLRPVERGLTVLTTRSPHAYPALGRAAAALSA